MYVSLKKQCYRFDADFKRFFHVPHKDSCSLFNVSLPLEMFPQELKMQLSKRITQGFKFVQNSIFWIKIISRLVKFY